MSSAKKREGQDPPSQQDPTATIAAFLRPILEPLFIEFAEQLAAKEPERPKLWTKTELAQYLDVSERQIDHLRKAGLPVRWVGDSPRFCRAEVDEFTKARRAG
jgi:hypothetical protein